MAHVLIIEDDSMIAAIERDFLEANGFEVSVAMTGKEGLKIFDGGAIEAVLLDIGLPDTDGFLLCRKLRDISNVPILSSPLGGATTIRSRDWDSVLTIISSSLSIHRK